jgi:hypothetical protein
LFTNPVIKKKKLNETNHHFTDLQLYWIFLRVRQISISNANEKVEHWTKRGLKTDTFENTNTKKTENRCELHVFMFCACVEFPMCLSTFHFPAQINKLLVFKNGFENQTF